MDKNIVEIGMEQTAQTGTDATLAVTQPGVIIYERLKPLLKEVIGRNIIRPLMSPRRMRYAF